MCIRDSLLQSLAGVRTPMVIVDRELEGVDADLVRIDHEQGAYLATQHLLELGHRDVAYIGGPAETGVTQLRLSGFRRARPKPVRLCWAAVYCTATSPARVAMQRRRRCWKASGPRRFLPATT